jgi:hypothetical protein
VELNLRSISREAKCLKTRSAGVEARSSSIFLVKSMIFSPKSLLNSPTISTLALYRSAAKILSFSLRDLIIFSIV